MTSRYIALLLPLTIAACGTNTVETVASAPVPAPPPETPATVLTDVTPDASLHYLPAGTMLHARLIEPVGTMNRTEDEFIHAEVIEPIISAEGETVIPVGTIVDGESHGPIVANGPHPALVRLDFEAITFEGLTYPISARVVGVDLAVRDGGISTQHAGQAVAGSVEARVPGAIVNDPDGRLTNLEFAYEQGTIVSLGDSPNPALPAGTRLMIRLVEATPLHSDPS